MLMDISQFSAVCKMLTVNSSTLLTHIYNDYQARALLA